MPYSWKDRFPRSMAKSSNDILPPCSWQLHRRRKSGGVHPIRSRQCSPARSSTTNSWRPCWDGETAPRSNKGNLQRGQSHGSTRLAVSLVASASDQLSSDTRETRPMSHVSRQDRHSSIAPFLNSLSHVQLPLPYRRRSSRQRQRNVKASLQIDGISNLRRGCSPAYPIKLPTPVADQSACRGARSPRP
jgi:hypothetical protein